MPFKTRQRRILIVCSILIISLFLSACGHLPFSGEKGSTGEFYYSGTDSAQNHSAQNHSAQNRDESAGREATARAGKDTTGGQTPARAGKDTTGGQTPTRAGKDTTGGQTPARAAENASAEQERFASFCDRVFREEMASASTLDLHYTLLRPETIGISNDEISLGSCSLSEMISAHKEQKELKEELQQFDFSLLSKEQQILYDTLLETLNASLLGEGLELYEQPLAPTIGVQAQLPILLAEYSFQTLEDVENYLALLSQIDEYYDEILAFENQKADSGLAPSDATIDKILESCESYRIDAENNFLTETFSARLDELAAALPEGLSAEQKKQLSERHISIIREHFIPAYEKLIDGVSALKGRGIHDGGLCGLADGNAYYEYLLKTGAGTSYTVEGLKAALKRQMEEDLSAIARLVRNNPSADFDDAAFSLNEPQEILSDLQAQMADDFPECPAYSYEIRYVPEYLESSLSPAFYLTAPVDDPNHNIIYINGSYPDSTDGLYTTLAHEGFPGHLYQTVYHRIHAGHSLAAVLSCSGANEGWATYVENLACTFDNGLSEEAGEYRARARSFSLCVHGILDIGINYDGWTEEQAGQFIASYFQVDDETAAELYQTMIDNPANYLEYCGGYVELMEMRREAEETIGGRFSPLEFHRFVLDLGPVPFPVMRKYFAKWLADRH